MIAPIVGKLRKRFIVDIGAGLGLGLAGGFTYWCAFCLIIILFCSFIAAGTATTSLRV